MTTARTVAVDLTPMLAGGDNGGAKVFVLELLRRLAATRADLRFVLLTQAGAHEELAALDAPNVRRVQVLGAAAMGGRSRLAAAWQAATRVFPTALSDLASRFAYAAHRRAKRRAAAAALREAAPQLLFSPFTAPTFHAPGVPTVSVVYDLQHRALPRFFTPAEWTFRECALREALREADAVVAISRFTAEAIAASGSEASAKVRMIPLRLARREEPADPGAFARHGLVPGRYFVYPANTWPHKNHAALLCAFFAARGRGLPGDFRLALPGAAANGQAEVERTLRGLNLGASVAMPGFVPRAELAALLRGACALVFPSLHEGFGIPVVEAMAAGVPVACSDSTALAEVAGDAALRFDATDVEAIAAAMLRLANEPGLRADLIARGEARAAAFADADAMAREYGALFDELLAR